MALQDPGSDELPVCKLRHRRLSGARTQARQDMRPMIDQGGCMA
jgi:hypothetical protein